MNKREKNILLFIEENDPIAIAVNLKLKSGVRR